MNLPEYTGNPLSVLTRITQKDAPAQLWHYAYKLTPLPGNVDTINRLIEQGYEQVSGDSEVEKGHVVACLISQLHDIASVRDGEQITVWAHHRSIEYVKKYPVLLCFVVENDEQPSTDRVQMLQFLPLPRHGERAIIGIENASSYGAHDLDETAQQLKNKIGQAILDLAGESQWSNHIPLHTLCKSEWQYLDLCTELQSRRLAFRGKRGQEAKAKLEKLEKAHHDIVTLRQSWLRPDWLHEWQEIRSMVQELAANYHDHHKKKQQEKDQQPKPPEQTPFFGEFGDLSRVCSANPVSGILASIHNAGSGADRWSEGGNGQYPSYRFVHNKQKEEREKNKMAQNSALATKDQQNSGYTIVEYGRSDDNEVIEDPLSKELYKHVQQLDDYVADVFLYTLAQLVKSNGEDAWVWAKDFLDHRGVVQIHKQDEDRDAGHRSEDIHRVGFSLYQIQKLWIKFREVIYKDPPATNRKPKDEDKPKKRVGKVFTHSGRILTVQQEWAQTTLFAADERANDRQPVAWKIHPGDWLLAYLDAPRIVAYFFEKSLQYDPYRQIWEKRLSRYFMFHLRINAKHQSHHITRGIGSLINESSLQIDLEHPERTRKRFEKAMDQLKEDKLIDDWNYNQESQQSLPRRQWLDTWMQWKVDVYAAARLKTLPDPKIKDKQ